MWHVNAYITEKQAFPRHFNVRGTRECRRALAYTHMRIVAGTGGRARYVWRTGIRMLTIRVKRAYGYMRAWRRRNTPVQRERVPRPYIRLQLVLTHLGL